MYNQMSNYSKVSIDHIKTAWEEDLGLELTEDEWNDAQRRVHSSSICARHGLIQMKILHKAHLSKVKIHKMYPDADPLCDRCRVSPATCFGAHVLVMPKAVTVLDRNISDPIRQLWACT